MKRPVAALIVALTGVATMAAASAATTLQDRQQLLAALKDTPPCCVIDARSQGQRLLHPLKDALAWRRGLRVKPTGAVVVLADDDRSALAAGRAIEKSSGAKQVLAVKGGFATWRSLAAPDPAAPSTFVIPQNTCDTGKSLQTLRSTRP
jgi:hypothetical protein